MDQPRIPYAAVAAAFPDLKLSFVGRGGQSDAWRGDAGGGSEILRVLVKADPQRTANEVAALKNVISPHLMRFYGLAELEHDGRTYPVIRGEFIAGGTVADAIGRDAWPGVTDVVSGARGVLEAVVALHAADLVHRDLKPGNLALRGGSWEDVVVLDLGYHRNLVGPPLTVYPNRIGTVAFMAPEQLCLEPAGLRADIYALGITLFLLLTRSHPFIADDDGPLAIDEVLDRMEGDEWPDWGRLPADTPAELRCLLREMLSYEPSDRPTSRRALRTIAELRT